MEIITYTVTSFQEKWKNVMLCRTAVTNNLRRLCNQCRRIFRAYQFRQFVITGIRDLIRLREEHRLLRLRETDLTIRNGEMGDAGLASIEEPTLAIAFLASRAYKKRLKRRKSLPGLKELLRRKNLKTRRSSNSGSPSVVNVRSLSL